MFTLKAFCIPGFGKKVETRMKSMVPVAILISSVLQGVIKENGG